jgi:Reverse transcriptase (RNA-dependent DNA polymerase)
MGEVSDALASFCTLSLESAVFVADPGQYPLRNCAILDSGSTIHIFHDHVRFKNYRRSTSQSYVIAGGSNVPILGFGNVDIEVQGRHGPLRFRLRDVAHCEHFACNIVSFRKLQKRGIQWDTKQGWLVRADNSVLCFVQDQYEQFILEALPYEIAPSVFATRISTWSTDRRLSEADGKRWHVRMGHLGKDALEHLVRQARGVKIKGLRTIECDACAPAHMKKQVRRALADHEPSAPFEEVAIDWHDFKRSSKATGEHTSVMFVTCRYSGYVMDYYFQSRGYADISTALKDLVGRLNKHFKLDIKTIRTDNEMLRSGQVKRWLSKEHIIVEPSAPNTQSQNGLAERSGGVIIRRSTAMRISAHLPADLWPEIVRAAVYLHNRSPKYIRNWQTPFERLFTYTANRDGIQGTQKPSITHLVAYGCKAWAMTTAAQLKKVRRDKLKPRAWLGYLVGYVSTNVFRIWNPRTGRIHLMRDVRFQENDVFDRTTYGSITQELLESTDDLIKEHEVPEADPTALDVQVQDEAIEDTIIVATDLFDEDCLSEQSDDEDAPTSATSDDDQEMSIVADTQYLTPDPSDDGSICAFLALWFDQGDEGAPSPVGSVPSETSCSDKNTAYWRACFQAGMTIKKPHRRDLPPVPRSHEEVLAMSEPLRTAFLQAERDHLQTNHDMGCWSEADRSDAKGIQVLDCMWVYAYKFEKHGRLNKCKARLVVRGDQEVASPEENYAATLAGRSFRTLIALTAHFDLETLQYDVVNAFINANLDDVVYMRMPPGYRKEGIVLLLHKALYGLRRSPLLWQKDLTGTLKTLGFEIIPQEPCAMIKRGLVVFFYVDDIVFAFLKKQTDSTYDTIGQLEEQYELTGGDELKWFLGIEVIRDREKRKIWLSQASYIEKIAGLCDQRLLESKKVNTPMTQSELLPYTGEATLRETRAYLRKTGSILYAAIITRPDVAFAVSRLTRFNANPGPEHHIAADRVLLYLYQTRFYALEFGGEEGLVVASDAAFADNSLDRKSSQGFVMKLFGGLISWQANKQDTVTTSSTEAELLALAQAAKEAMFIGRLLCDLTVRLDERKITIHCDNKQTIRLVKQEIARLVTKLKHVDIHHHWLRQAVQEGTIDVIWVPTKEMMADGLTKALPREQFDRSRKQLNLKDIQDLILESRAYQEKNDDRTSKPTTQIEEGGISGPPGSSVLQ